MGLEVRDANKEKQLELATGSWQGYHNDDLCVIDSLWFLSKKCVTVTGSLERGASGSDRQAWR